MKSQHQHHEKHGKMTVKQLAAQNRGMQSVEVTDENIGSFQHVARKYGVDFAPYKVKGENKYLIFFKSGDKDAMTAAFEEYSKKLLTQKDRPSVRSKLRELKELVATLNPVKEKRKELER